MSIQPSSLTPLATEPPSSHKSSIKVGGTELLHLATLNALVIAQPLLERLQKNTGYLTQEAITPVALVLTTVVFLFAVPLLLWSGCRLLGRVTPRCSRLLYLLGLGLLLFCGLNLLGRAVARSMYQTQILVPGVVYLLLAAGGTWWLLREYQVRDWFRRLLTYASISVVLFPLNFLFSKPIRPVLFPQPVADEVPTLTATRPSPIVWIVFDGLAGMALLDETHQIDAQRFPAFSRLAGMSTYYRNASTVHPRTDKAVPAMLTGKYPEEIATPVLVDHPDNLFTLLLRTNQYEAAIFEPYTRLCPPSLRRHPRSRSPWKQLPSLLWTCSLVYLKTTFPQDIPGHDAIPAIPRTWFRLPDEAMVDRRIMYGMMMYDWDSDRDIQVDHFLDCLQAPPLDDPPKPGLRFLHVMLPHYPWCFLPDGQRYADYMTADYFPLGAYGELGEQWVDDPLAAHSSWKRYLIQLQYADRELGRILQALEDRGTLDETLLIVTADHGESFVPGTNRRAPSAQTLPEILPVPLFIKYPGQQAAEVTDRNVETIDILPTLADVIGLDLPMPVDGESLLDSDNRPRLRKTLYIDNETFVVEGDFPERFRAIDRYREFWGPGHSDILQKCLVLPELVGKSVENFRMREGKPLELFLTWGATRDRWKVPHVIPCLFEGEVVDLTEPSPAPLYLAITIDGVIAGVTRTLDDEEYFDRWSVLIPPDLLHGPDTKIEIFQVIPQGTSWELLPCIER